MTSPIHLAVALEGTGWHPASWRSDEARPAELFTAGYWVDLVREAERGLVDLVTVEDSLALQSTQYAAADRRTDLVRGRLDALLVASRVGPLTSHVGLVPSVTVTHTEPFHVSKAVATLDYVSTGRGGVRVQVSGRAHEAALFGRRDVPALSQADLIAGTASGAGATLLEDLFAEAEDYVEVLRRLWDSWEDDAEIRDVATGRFIDRTKLHYVDFVGRWFSVKGPSITPRPPQGQPPVLSLAHTDLPARFGGRTADVVLITPHDVDQLRQAVDHVRAGQESAGRPQDAVHVWADVAVALAPFAGHARPRLDHLDDLAGRTWAGDDVTLLAGTAAQVADVLEEWHAAGVSGFRLRPAALPYDLGLVVDLLVPELQRRGLYRTAYQADTLRGHLGLPRPANRYAAA